MASTVALLWAKRLENPDDKYNNFNQVPSRLQDEVRQILTDDGYVIDLDGTVHKAEEE